MSLIFILIGNLLNQSAYPFLRLFLPFKLHRSSHPSCLTLKTRLKTKYIPWVPLCTLDFNIRMTKRCMYEHPLESPTKFIKLFIFLSYLLSFLIGLVLTYFTLISKYPLVQWVLPDGYGDPKVCKLVVENMCVWL